MNDIRLTCASCGRSWPLGETPSIYLELILETQPCPGCEAYTLNCHGTSDAGLRRNQWGARQQDQLPDQASGPNASHSPQP